LLNSFSIRTTKSLLFSRHQFRADDAIGKLLIFLATGVVLGSVIGVFSDRPASVLYATELTTITGYGSSWKFFWNASKYF